MKPSKKKKRTATPKKKTTPSQRRGKGRPADPKMSVGSEVLVEKTCELLSKLPPRQVTRAAVARAVGVDPSLIRYYFKSRSALLLAAFVRLTDNYTDLLAEESELVDTSPEGQLTARVSALFRLTAVYPYYHSLIIEEIAVMKDPKARKVLKELTVDRVNAYKEIFDAGKSNKSFKDVDAGLMFIVIIGMCHFFTSGSEILKLATGKRTIDDKMVQSYHDLICDILINGIRRS